LSRTVKGCKDGLCDICYEYKPTVEFEDENIGYEGWDVQFEICKDCFLAKLEEAIK